MAVVNGRLVTVGVLGVVCLVGAVLTSWLLGQTSFVIFLVVFGGLVVIALIRPPNE